MADETTRLITSIEIKGAREHDATLENSIRLVNAYADAASTKVAGIESVFNSAGRGMREAASASGTLGSASSALSARITENKAAMALQGAAITDNRSKMLELSRSIDSAKQSFGGQSDVVKRLEAEYKTLSFDTRTLIVDKSKLSNETAGLRVALTAEQTALKAEEAALKAARAEAEKAASAHKKLGEDIRDAGQNLSTIGRNVTLATAPLLALGAAALLASTDVNSGLREIRVRTGETGASLDGLKASFKTVFANVPADAAEVGAALGGIHARTGQVGEGLENLSRQVLELSNITHTDLNANVAATTRAFADWSIETGKQSGAMDEMFRASQQTGISITKLMELVVQFGSPLRSLGFNFDQALAVMGKFEKEGVNIETTLPGLRRELGNFAKAGIDAKTGFGLVIDSMKNARTEAEGLTIAVKVFGQRAAVDMFRAVKEGRFDIDDLTRSIKTGRDTILSAAGDTRTFGESWKILQNQVELALAPLGRELQKAMKDNMPLMQEGVGHLTDLVKWFSELDPATKKAIIGIGGVTLAIGPLLFGFGQLATAISTTYLAAVKFAEVAPTVIASLRAINIATAASTLGWLGLAAAVSYALYKIGQGQPSQKLGPTTGRVVAETGVGGSVNTGVGMAALGFIQNTQTLHQAGKYAGGAFIDGMTAGVETNKEKPDAAIKKWIDDLSKKHKAGGHAAGKAVADGFKGGLAGFEDALKVIASATPQQIGELADVLGKKARAGLEELSRAFKDATPVVNEFLQAQGAGAKVTAEELETMAKRGDLSLLNYTASWRKAQESIRQAGIQMAENLKSPISAINDLLHANGVDLTITAEMYSHLSDAQKASVGTLDQYAQQAKANKQVQDELKLSIAANTIEQNKHANAMLFSQGIVGMLSGATAAFQSTINGGIPVLDTYKTAMDAAFVIGSQQSVVAVTGLQDKIKGLNEAIKAGNVSGINSDLNSLRDDMLKLAETSGKSSADVDAAIQKIISSIANMPGKSKAAVDATVSSWQTLREQANSTLRDLNNQIDNNAGIIDARLKLGTRSAIDSVISDYERLGVQLGKSGQQLEDYVEQHTRKALENNTKITGDELNKAIELHKRAANQLPGIWETVFKDMSSSSRRELNLLFDVVGSMPGAVGDSLRKTQSQIEQWLKFLDSSTKLIQTLLGQQATGVKGIFDSIAGVFGKTQQSVQVSSTGIINGTGLIIKNAAATGAAVTGAMSTAGAAYESAAATAQAASVGMQSAADQAASATESAANRIEASLNRAGDAWQNAKTSAQNSASSQLATVSKLAGDALAILGGVSMIISGHQQGGFSGGIQGAMGGLVAGATIGSMIAPGIGTLIGAGIGAVGGFLAGFFGGHSELQKAQDAAALQQAKDAIKLSQQQVIQALEASKQAIVSTASQVADLIEKIGNSTHVPKAVIKTFVKDMGILLSQLADGLNAVSSKATPELKAAAEVFQSVVGLAVAAPDAINAIGRSIPVAQSSFDVFFSNANKLWDGFEAAAEDVTKHERKAANKFAESYGNVIGTVAPSIDAVANFFKIRRISQDDVDTWVANIVLIETGIAKAADSLDFYGVKQGARLADAATATLTFVQQYAATQKDIVGITIPSASDYDNLFGGARLAVQKSIEFTKDLNAEGLLLASAIFGEGSKLFDALKAEIDFALKVGDLKNVDWNALPDSIQRLYEAAKLSVILASEASKAIGLDLTQEAAAFAEAATTVVQLYDATAKSFGDASITRDIYPATIENIANGIELAIRGIAGIRQRVTDAMLKESEGAAAGINASLSVISAAGSAFKDLGIDDSGKAPNFNIQVIDNLLSITEYSFNRIVELAHKVKPEDRAAAVAFSTDTHVISTNMADGLGFLKTVADQPALSVSSFDTMVSNVANMDTALGHALDSALHMRDESADFLAATVETKDNVLAGMSNIADALAAATSSSNASLSSGDSFGAQSFGASPFPPTNFAPSPGGSHAPAGNNATPGHTFNFSGNVYLNGEQAPAEIEGQVEQAMNNWWDKKVAEELHKNRAK